MVLTILVRIVLVPLMVRQIHSMQSLQVHAPEMKAIQQKWKHDRQRQNEELMKFYRENKINPAASCLPLVAQIPVFISLYLVLRHFERHTCCRPRRLASMARSRRHHRADARTAGARCSSSSTSSAS